jgi:hypothetical protein
MTLTSYSRYIVPFLPAVTCGCVSRPMADASSSDFEGFLGLADKAQLEFQQGRSEAYKALWSHQSDVSLGGGFGGGFELGWNKVATRLDWASSQFANGRNEIKRIASATSGDLASLVQMEHLQFTPPQASAEVERIYRVTMVFRLENGQWRIIHRHADTQISKEAPR